jgi:hypothetical protein
MIYFIQSGPAGPIKIGTTVDLDRRLRSLQIAHSVRLTVLGTVPGDAVQEAALHAELAADRIRGEWFRPSHAVLAALARASAPETTRVGDRWYAVLRRPSDAARCDPCPFCGARHAHGIGDGHRGAHCLPDRARDLITPSGVELRHTDGYIVRTRSAQWRVAGDAILRGATC